MRKFLLPTVILPRHSGFRMHEAFAGAPGVAYDFTSSGGLTQDRGGLTPVSAAAQNIGLAHDYSRASSGWVSGTELVNYPSWIAADASWSVNEGSLTAVNGSNFGAYQPGALVTGRAYLITLTVTSYVSGTVSARANSVATGIALSGTGTQSGVAVANGPIIYVMGNGNFNGTVQISVREITGNPLIAPTDARRGTWSTMPNGLPCLALNGTSQCYATAGPVNPGDDEVHVWAAVRALSNATNVLVESGAIWSGNAGSLVIYRDASLYAAGSRGTSSAVQTSSGFSQPDSAVLYMRAKISTDTLTLARNGTQIATSSADQGTGNYTSQILNVGARNAASPSLFFNGQIARLAVLYGPISADQKAIIDELVMQGFAPSP